MAIRAALLLIPLVAFAQTPPGQVDQALRARTTEFFQYFVDGQYRKAFDLVAEESKDEFFGSSKAELKSFSIDDIKYSNDFTKATVVLAVKRVWRVQGQEALAEIPMTTTWKIENDKWVWYHQIQDQTWVTAMGPSTVAPLMRKPDGTVTGVPDKINQDVVMAAAQQILQQSSVDKNLVTLATDKASSDKVVFHNGAPGSIRLELTGVPKIPGFTATLDKADVNFNENAVLQVAYQPTAEQKENPPPTAYLSLLVSPFNQRVQVEVDFGTGFHK